MALSAGCDKSNSSETERPTDPGGSDTASATDTASDTGAAGDADAAVDYVIAIDEDFDDWEGGGDLFYMSNGNVDDYDDNNTRASVDGHECLAVHANAATYGGSGYSVEIQLQLDQRTDMSRGDFSISFDIYVPSDTLDKGGNVQFAFFETDGTWGIEGHGVEPDVEVIDDPALMVDGQDPQLDAAIEQMLQELKRTPHTPPKRPAYPDRSGMGIRREDK